MCDKDPKMTSSWARLGNTMALKESRVTGHLDVLAGFGDIS